MKGKQKMKNFIDVLSVVFKSLHFVFMIFAYCVAELIELAMFVLFMSVVILCKEDSYKWMMWWKNGVSEKISECFTDFFDPML